VTVSPAVGIMFDLVTDTLQAPLVVGTAVPITWRVLVNITVIVLPVGTLVVPLMLQAACEFPFDNVALAAETLRTSVIGAVAMPASETVFRTLPTLSLMLSVSFFVPTVVGLNVTLIVQ